MWKSKLKFKQAEVLGKRQQRKERAAIEKIPETRIFELLIYNNSQRHLDRRKVSPVVSCSSFAVATTKHTSPHKLSRGITSSAAYYLWPSLSPSYYSIILFSLLHSDCYIHEITPCPLIGPSFRFCNTFSATQFSLHFFIFCVCMYFFLCTLRLFVQFFALKINCLVLSLQLIGKWRKCGKW